MRQPDPYHIPQLPDPGIRVVRKFYMFPKKLKGVWDKGFFKTKIVKQVFDEKGFLNTYEPPSLHWHDERWSDDTELFQFNLENL